MRIILISTFIGLLAISSAVTEHCTRGHSYTEDCNTCTCTDSGIYACTERACYYGSQFPDTATQAPSRKRRDVEPKSSGCDKGQSYFDGCNTCVCAVDKYACTRKLCLPAPVIQPASTKTKRDVTASTPGCDKGQSYFDGCNTCVCSGDKYACTLKFCYEGPQFPDTVDVSTEAPSRKRRDVEPKSSGCDKGQSYFDGCNTCVCSGDKYACTLKFCYEGPQFPDTVDVSTEAPSRKRRDVEPKSSGCDKGQSYFDGCNTCVCSGDKYACTLKFCYDGPQFPDTVDVSTEAPSRKRRDVEPDSKKLSAGCNKGPEFTDKCNTCRCVDDRYLCFKNDVCDQAETSEADSRKSREIYDSTGKYDLIKKNHRNYLRFDVETCTPNEVKNQECNRCKCTKNGKGWMCTRKACPKAQN